MPVSHEDIDERSLILHRRVAERLRAEPSLIEIARTNLRRWKQKASDADWACRALKEWQELLESLDLEEICALIEEQSERARRLRQNSPFAGVLSASEVWKIKERFRRDERAA